MNTPIILTPGPVWVPDFVMQALAKPPVHHRSQAFNDLFAQLQEGMQYLFQTKGQILALGGSGTFAVELAMRGVFHPGDRILVLESGKFGERWRKYGEELGLEVVALTSEWGQNATVEEVLKVMEAHADWAGIVVTHCETSTGAGIDLEEMAFQVRSRYPDIILFADTISTVGVIPFYMDAWGVDVAFTSSQKALMNPAGTTYIALSERAKAQIPSYSGEDIFSLARYVEAADVLSYPVTPPTQLFYGILAVLGRIQTETLPSWWNRSHHLSRRLKAALPEMGGSLFGNANSDALTAFTLPGKDAMEVLTQLKEESNIEIAGGQSGWKGKLLRVAHFGSAGEAELDLLVEALLKMYKS